MSDSKFSQLKRTFQKPAYFKEDEIEAFELISKGHKNIDLRSEISDGRKIDSFEDEEIIIHHKFSNSCKKDPRNKNFEFAYEIPFSSTYDFIFDNHGDMPELEFLNNTRKIRKIPKHLKYTLFVNDEIKNIRKKNDFSYIAHKFSDYKDKGNKFYKKKKFREAAYSLLNWIEYTKEPKNLMNLLKTTTPILDEEINIVKCFRDMNAIEEDSYRFYTSTLLLALGYAFIKLRHFTSALECLTECISISENFSSDAYFRRSQVRFYNKKSKEEDLNLALNDINKAISINYKNNSKLYNLHLKNVLNSIKRYKEIENMRVNNLLSEAFNLFINNTNKNEKKNLKKNDLMIKENNEVTTDKIYSEQEGNCEELNNEFINSIYLLDSNSNNNNIKTNSTNKRKDSNLSYLIQCNSNKKGLSDRENETDIMIQFNILKQMKSKYLQSIKYYTEIKNEEQINYAYLELEALFETYENFKFFFKFELNQLPQNLQKIVYKTISNITINKSEKNLENYEEGKETEKHDLNFNRNINELKKILGNLKKKKADEIFQKGNYNLDLFEFVARKVLSNVKNDKSKKLNLLKDGQFDKTKNELTKFLKKDENSILRNLEFSTIMTILVMLISVLMIYMHFHLYFKNLSFRNI